MKTMPILKIEETGREREIEITGDRLTIGRLPENDIALMDSTVSRNHAEIVLGAEGYVLKDLDSRNGIRVNGKMIKNIKLQDRDVIKIGTSTMRFLFSPRPSVVYDTREEWLSSPSTMVKAPQGPSFKVSDQKKLEILYNISQATNSIFDLKELTEKVAEEILGVINADRFLLMLKDEKTSQMIPQMAIGRDKGEVELSISRTMVERVTTEGVSILVRDISRDTRFKQAQSLILKKITSCLCAPLWSKEGIIGLIYVESKQSGKSFSEDELELFTAIGNHAAGAFQNIRMQEKLWQKKRIERELEIAAIIQQSFLPQDFPSCHGYSFGVKSIPAQNVGGDFYDCFSLSSNRIGLVVGDVSGKGIPAALYMARFLNEFKIASVNFSEPGLLMKEMNDRFKDIVVRGSFVSAAYLILELDTGILHYCLAGCHPVLLYQNKEKTVKELGGCSGQILGIGEGVFKDENIFLGCGDMAVLYTDGVIEVKGRKKEEFGLERLKKEILRVKDLPPAEAAERIVQGVFEFSGREELSDDLTLLVLKRGE